MMMTSTEHGDPVMDPEEFIETVGSDDTWGIINWAMESNREVWVACPSARQHLIEAAAFRRWEAHHRDTEAAAWLAFARWITANLHLFPEAT